MSDQREIHIDYEKLQQLLFNDDEETRLQTLKAIDGIFEIRGKNAVVAQTRIMGIFSENLSSFKELLLTQNPAVQVAALGVMQKMVELKGADAPDVSFEAIEIIGESKFFYVKDEAQKLLGEHLKTGANRGDIMKALRADAALMNWENACFFRNLATSALQYNEVREYALGILGSIISYKNAPTIDRQNAILTIEALLMKGSDISSLEREIRSLAKQRNDPFSEQTRVLLAAAEAREFNRPGGKGFFKRVSVALTPVFAPAPLRRTGTTA
jgi:hypothetical protein